MNFFSTSNKKPQDNKAEPAAAAEAEAQATEQQTTEDATATMNPAEIEQLKTELEAAKAAEADLKDKYLRALADMENLRHRSKREVQDASDYAMQKFAKDLLEFADNLERALAYVPEEARTAEGNTDLKNLYEGVEGTQRQLQHVFARYELLPVNPLGEKFDPELHEALFQVPDPNQAPGTVAQVMHTGYTLKGRLLRAAGVGVVVKA